MSLFNTVRTNLFFCSLCFEVSIRIYFLTKGQKVYLCIFTHKFLYILLVCWENYLLKCIAIFAKASQNILLEFLFVAFDRIGVSVNPHIHSKNAKIKNTKLALKSKTFLLALITVLKNRSN